MDGKNILGNRIKDRRKDLKMTQTELGELVKVNKQTICRWEKGQVNRLTTAKISELGDALRCSPLWLMGMTDETDYTVAVMDAIESEVSFMLKIMDVCEAYGNIGKNFTETDWVEIVRFIQMKAQMRDK